MGLFDRIFGKREEEAAAAATAAIPSAVANASTAAPIEEYDEIEPELLEVMARLKGRAAPAKPVKALATVLYPVTAAIVADERRKEIARRKAEEEALKNPQPGQKMPDGTIYLGQYTPKDRDGKSLSKTFNVFAAAEDLPETMKYVDAVKYIASKYKAHGYDGTNYATDKELYAAIKSGSYNGGWIIPTRDILHGKDIDGKETTPDNILAHKDKGSFKDTFKTAASSGSDYPDWYWSSTENRDNSSNVWNVRLSDGNDDWNHKDNNRLSCRPVRLVEVSTPRPGAG